MKSNFNRIQERILTISELKTCTKKISPKLEIPFSALDKEAANEIDPQNQIEILLEPKEIKKRLRKQISLPNMHSIAATQDCKLVFLMPRSKDKIYQFNTQTNTVEGQLQYLLPLSF